MMLTLRDDAGCLTAAIDYYLVNDEGHVTLDGSGTHVWVEQVEIGAEADGRRVIPELIRRIADALPHATDAYWYRKAKTKTRLHRFSRHRLTKEVGV